MIRFLICLVLCFSLTSCFSYKKTSGISLQEQKFSDLQGWNASNINNGFKAFRKTCSVIGSSKIQRSEVFSGNKNIWKNKCAESRSVRSPKRYFEENFKPYLVTHKGTKTGVFTGYFEKEIEASLVKTSEYKYPIYTMPVDKSMLKYSRKEIENGALKNQHLEFAYAKSAARLFFLQIQGSGVLKLPDGSKIKVGFAGKNNYEYTSIGSYMLKQGLIQKGTAEDIIEWLEKNPVGARSVMSINESYIFFDIKKGGPFGTLGLELTEQASLAVDPVYIPLGTPIWLQTTLSDKQRFTRLMNAQDTGSAIKGPIRGDIFFGSGDWARITAGEMKGRGSYYILLPKEINTKAYF